MNRSLARRRVVAKRVQRESELVQLKCAQTIRRSDGPEVVEPLRSCWKQSAQRHVAPLRCRWKQPFLRISEGAESLQYIVFGTTGARVLP